MVGLNTDKLFSTVDNITDTVGNNIESEQERQATLTERLRIDTTSPFKLPHLIRPISFIWAMGLQTLLSVIVVVMAFNQNPTDTTSILAVVGSNGAILTSMVGFYFSSRKQEKINLEKVKAAVKIEEMKTGAAIKEEKKDNRAERREKRKPLFNRK